MSPEKSSGCIPIVQPDKSVVSTPPTLSEISERDKPWDKHRGNTDKAKGHYRNTEFDTYASRMTFCSELLDFKLVPDQAAGDLKLKLSSARFCRVRHCPVCQWRRSLMWKAKAYKILPDVVRDFPKYRWLFLTLTQRNCPITELKAELSLMGKAWQRLSQRKKFPAVGWIRSTEVTRGKDGSAHPHFHCLLLVPSSYFGVGYIKQAEWCELWQRALKVDYQPILDVQALKQSQQPMQLVPELLKYCVKESDLVNDAHWFLELTRQMHRVRCVATGGVLKDYLKALEEEPEDLIGESDENEIDEGHLRFGWKRTEKKYRMVD